MTIIETRAKEFAIQPWQAEAVIRLLDEGATVPFIARYRKEQHGSLDDQKLRDIADRLASLRALEQRRAEILNTMTTLGVLTDELQAQVEAAATMGQLEDLYRPYRPKRRTRAMIAREKGLEPLADTVLLQLTNAKTPEELAADVREKIAAFLAADSYEVEKSNGKLIDARPPVKALSLEGATLRLVLAAQTGPEAGVREILVCLGLADRLFRSIFPNRDRCYIVDEEQGA